jgi:hypothetical protein
MIRYVRRKIDAGCMFAAVVMENLINLYKT